MPEEILGGFQSEEEYYEVLKYIMDTGWTGILVANSQGQYIYSNKAYKEITGMGDCVIRQLSAIDMEESIIREKLSSTRLVLEKKKEVILEQSPIHSSKTYLVKGVPFYDEAGKIKFVISNLLDSTILSQYQKQVKKTKEEKKVSFQEFEKIIEQQEQSEEIIYKSRSVARVMEQINLVAKTDTTVFFRGESGTGKELFAKRLHNESDRKEKPFIKINCSAIPEPLLESELFGYEAGTFTGGNLKGKKGLLEYADGGTLLLDEIGDMPFNLQSKLLRVLQEKEFTKLGGHIPIKIDIRFIAATNTDIEKMVREKKFRQDLYYRLNIIPIYIPSLGERREDIPLLIYHFVEKFNRKYQLKKTISYELVERMLNKPFPGNVRQLQNFLERLMLLSTGNKLTKKDFDRLYHNETCNPVYDLSFDFGEKPLTELMEEYEKFILTEYKKKYKSSYKMAEKLKMNQSTIFRKLQKYGIEK